METTFKLIKKDYDAGWRQANLGEKFDPSESGCYHSFLKGFRAGERC